jgi:hypothetical protein
MAKKDLGAAIEQSLVDKVISSVSFPLTLVDINKPFPHRKYIGQTEILEPSYGYEYSQKEASEIMKSADSQSSELKFSEVKETAEVAALKDIKRGASELIESAKRCLVARDEAEKTGQSFIGPDRKQLEGILKGGVAGVATFKGFKLEAWCPWLKVDLRTAPSVQLNGPTLSVTGITPSVSATGELWAYMPHLKCSSLCFKWEVTWGWDRWASITVQNIKLKADAHADIYTKDALVWAKGVFDKLRLDYKILDKIKLEGIANDKLKDKPLLMYDAGAYIQTIPVLGSKFHVTSVSLPKDKARLAIDIEIGKV